MNIPHAIILAVAAYAGIGFLVSIAFVTLGVGAIDPSARHAPWGFRLVILPGAAALWPLVLKKWITMTGRRHAS